MGYKKLQKNNGFQQRQINFKESSNNKIGKDTTRISESQVEVE